MHRGGVVAWVLKARLDVAAIDARTKRLGKTKTERAASNDPPSPVAQDDAGRAGQGPEGARLRRGLTTRG